MTKQTAVIEEIHEKFMEAGQALIEDIRFFDDPEVKRKALEAENDVKALMDLGFTNFKQTKTHLNVEEKLKSKELSADDVRHYSEKYPTYKFITQTSVDRIAKEYVLRFGRAESFTGEIPSRNQKEMIRANKEIKKEDRVVTPSLQWKVYDHDDFLIETIDIEEGAVIEAVSASKGRDSFSRLRAGLASNMGVGIPSMADVKDAHTYPNTGKWCLVLDGKRIEATIRWQNSSWFTDECSRALAVVGERFYGSFVFIVAPLDEFKAGPAVSSVDDLEVAENALELIPDPIVLFEVKTKGKERGFLIGSAWGDEASDPDVVNERLN